MSRKEAQLFNSDQRRSAQVSSRALTVLVVEDNDSVALAIRRVLEISNFIVLHVSSGEDAIQATRDQVPDLVLMDLKMPGLGGLESIRQIRALPECATIPIIATSGGLVAVSESDLCRDAGANLYIGKPYHARELVSHITELCHLTLETV